ncbi:hypothetical protein [Xylophilus sp. GOD-11R]|uniref:hypothetical protein n=1 Tax=Xylophilus sp. GOD-11R TaxID=3089814 RepID=UPI00298CE028|nr:hypothetical protein [Xylophilus sp. GOD-11R]WPB55538.1 hypothetical protein R9X41_15475 [Xylophilus sp. GOD-11R]
MRQPSVSNRNLLATLVACSALLAACGDSNDPVVSTGTAPPAPGPAAPPPPGTPASTTLTGVAATGAPFGGATIVVTPQSGDPITCAAPSAADGTFRCELPAGTVAPLVLTATLGDQVHYSVSPSAASGTVNISPLTDVIVSQLSPTGDPAALAAAVRSDATVASATAVQTQTTRLTDALQSAFAALGQATTNPLTTVFTADGTGLDKLLDTLLVNIRPTGTSANVSIAVRTTDTVPPAVTFITGTATTATPITPLPAITPTAVATLPTPAVVADFFNRFTACYALPASQRVNGGSDTGAVTGTAADVIAPACRTLFVNDDPASYYNNGLSVGRNANNVGAFAGLFRGAATGVRFDKGVAEFQRSNPEKDVVVSYRQTDNASNVTYDTLVVRNVGGSLKLIGNGSQFVARIRPYQEYRELINTPAFSWYNVGYNVDIDNVLVNGAPIFNKVVVTPPAGVVDNAGTTFTYVPSAGTSYLVVQGSAGLTAIRLNAEFQDTANTAPVSSKEVGLGIVNPVKTNAELAANPEQGVWSFEFFFADGRPNVIQSTRTLARPLSIAELRVMPMMDLTPGLRAEAIETTAADGAVVFGPPTSAEPNLVQLTSPGDQDGWFVPAGAQPPTSLNVLGNAPFGSNTANPNAWGLDFSDNIGLAGNQRKVDVYCARQSLADLHCDATNPSSYAQGTRVRQLSFSSQNQKLVQTSRRFAFYKLQ